MIVKNKEGWKYKVKYVKQNPKSTTFQIAEKPKGSTDYTYYTVLSFSHLDLQDGDEVQFKDYEVEAKVYNQRPQVTLFVKPEDVVIITNGNSGAEIVISADDLPF